LFGEGKRWEVSAGGKRLGGRASRPPESRENVIVFAPVADGEKEKRNKMGKWENETGKRANRRRAGRPPSQTPVFSCVKSFQIFLFRSITPRGEESSCFHFR